MSTYAGSKMLLGKRRLELVKLAHAHGWDIRSLYFFDTPCITATRGEDQVTIWLSKAGAVLDVTLKVPNGRFADNGAVIYRYVSGRGRAAAERALTNELANTTVGVL